MTTLIEILEIKCRRALSSAVQGQEKVFPIQKRKLTSMLSLFCSTAWYSLMLRDDRSCLLALIQVPSSAHWNIRNQATLAIPTSLNLKSPIIHSNADSHDQQR